MNYLFIIIISVSGGSHEYVADYNLTLSDCIDRMEQVTVKSECVLMEDK